MIINSGSRRNSSKGKSGGWAVEAPTNENVTGDEAREKTSGKRGNLSKKQHMKLNVMVGATVNDKQVRKHGKNLQRDAIQESNDNDIFGETLDYNTQNEKMIEETPNNRRANVH